jgi:uncharacterized protein (UPF0332 family)
MNEIDFLNKLKKEGRLGPTEMSNEIKMSYLKKSESNIFSAKLLLENEKLEEAISLAYYSMYNMLLALLFNTGIKSENHSASIILLNMIFGLDNSGILRAKKERIQSQYYVNFKLKKQEVKDLLKITEDFNAGTLDFISKLTNDRINAYRNKFIKMIKFDINKGD